MKKEKSAKPKEVHEDLETVSESSESFQEGKTTKKEDANKPTDNQDDAFNLLKKQLDEKTKQCDEYLNMLQRTAAEFDNFKKRTAREKEALYAESVGDVVISFLPVVDNLERALGTSGGENDTSFKEGIELVLRQMKDVLKNLGVNEIKSVGESFDPQIHNAVMHIEDENHGENVVVEEFQKGYILKERVIRHSMVKVAN